MKFKRLEVQGFKSFADKLEIKFGSGITGIVGPNGCGKSNVADAVRWVLGEQSAKLLRGSSMQDVIFNGTGKRKSMSFCEVSLFFDNTADKNGSKLFPALEYKEVVISRKLYRSGESEYLLNRQTCRLKDITELLREGHMGREGYSIIGQGRIDELLSAKAEDRRAIFEEAAGIAKFKVKKIESERKLARTTDNLVRIGDILKEKAAQLDPLTRQSQNARRWLGLRDQLKHHEINIYIHQYDTANDAKRVIGERLTVVTEELTQKNKESDAIGIEYNESMAKLARADNDIEALREKLLELTVGIERDAGEVKLLNERLGHLNAQSERLAVESGAAKLEHEEAISVIATGTEALVERQAKLEELIEVEKQVSAAYLSVVTNLSKGENEADKRHKEVIEAMEKLAEIKSNMGRLVAEREGLIVSVDDLTKRSEFMATKLSSDITQEAALAKEIDELEKDKLEFVATRDKLSSSHNDACRIVGECAAKLDKLQAEFYNLSSRLKMFKEMHEANEALGGVVKKLLRDAKDNSKLASNIEGVIAQIVKVKEGFEIAVATALGNSIQNIVTASEVEAKFLIAYLKEKRYGQITFLPITTIKPRSIEERYKSFLKGDGIFGSAIDCINFDAKFDPVIRGLLGGTVFVKNMDVAVELAKKTGYGFRIVTLEGDIVMPSGAMTGGSKRSELNNVFGYEREIETLSAKVSELDKSIKELAALRELKNKEQEFGVKTINELSDKIHAIDVALATKVESHSKLADILSDEKAQLGALNSGVEAAKERIEAIDLDINSVSKLENTIASSKNEASECDSKEREKHDLLRTERDRLHDETTNAKVAVSDLAHEIEAITAEIKRLQASAIGLAERLEVNARQLEENHVVTEKIERDLKSFSLSSRQGDSDKVKEIRAKLNNLDEQKQAMQNSIAVLDERRSGILEQIQVCFEKKSKEEQLLLKVDTDIEYMQQRVLEEYELTYGACLIHKEHGYNATEGSELAAKLKRQMQAIGHVNLESIELCKQVYEDYHALNIQKDDLVKAKDDLEKIIADLSKEMLSRFNEHFETIRTNFVKIFRELFNGGTADLILLDNENPLEAGIDIVAQPPEKKLQTISLLSGGERALTAIAILFAILRLRPMPFCILDEIEAALDDANAGRFAKYLRRFSGDTQFIVITHRKPTMELADALFGVTMEEKGVSKIVSVKLAEAISVAEPA